MLAKALEYENFDKFDRVRFPKIRYAGMLQYDGELKLPSRYLLSPPEIERTSGEYLVHNGFFNPEMEEYVEIPSDSGITFNVKPKMNALEIAEKARNAILRAKFHQLHVNLPNSDMVGHTGYLGRWFEESETPGGLNADVSPMGGLLQAEVEVNGSIFVSKE
ncbi:hypothetical protein Cgig2_013544 [Carnegiea gigantea]|uniref:Metalloenzyme domain-containing protein n=1 Tax=Carnegiea gigantea TaxID=171969 RepID=A0A9Q1JUT4_9CARY|nr:hypothetical protein Cgig2_013544 [Carnegiea gigantea]